MTRARLYAFLIIAAAFAASASATIFHSTPKKALRRRHPNPKALAAAAPPFIPRFDQEQRLYLNAHNDVRRAMGMPPLVWNATLAAAARAWAERRSGDCDVRRHSRTPYGENIFVMSYREYSPRDVVQSWFSESKMYDAKRQRCMCVPERPGCECGHFLNVVWRTTTRLGCSGAVYCDGQKGSYVVCEYDPPGSTFGMNPFTGLPLFHRH